MIRAVRLAATLEAAIEPATLAGIQARADHVRHLSGERIAAELEKLLAAPIARRSAFGCWPTRACSRGSRPELAAQRGIPQNKVPGEDLWDHTLRSGRCRRPRPGVSPAGRAPARHRQAVDLRRRPVHRPRRRGCEHGGGRPRPAALAARGARAHRPPGPAAHVRLRAGLVRRGHPAVHRQGRPRRARRPVPPARGRQRRGPGARPDAGQLAELRGAGPARARRRRRPRPARPGDPWRRPDRRARAVAGAGARPHPRRAARAGHRRSVASTGGRSCSPRPAPCTPRPPS